MQKGLGLLSRNKLLAVALELPLAFYLLSLALNPAFIFEACSEHGDFAVIGLRTISARKLELLLGPYSRFGFSHPGPITFYFYALVTPLLSWVSSPSGQIILAQVILNFLGLSWALFLVGQSTKNIFHQILAFAIFLLAIGNARDGTLFSTWNPASVIVPCYLTLISAGVFSTGKAKALIPLLVGAVFCIENHLSLAPVIAVVFFIATTFYFLSKEREKISIRLILLSLLWLSITLGPPIVEALSNPSFGNLGKIYRFMQTKGDTPNIYEAFALVFGFFRAPFFGFFPVTALVLPLIIFGFSIWTCPNPSSFIYKLRVILLAAVITSAISALGVKDGLHRYIFWYQYALVAGSYFVLLISFLESEKIHAKLGSGFWKFSTAIILATTLALTILEFIPPDSELRCGKRNEILSRFELSKDSLYRLRTYKHSDWKFIADLMLQMERQGFSGCVDSDWEFMFGPTYTCVYRKSASPWNTMNYKLLDYRSTPEKDDI